MILSDHLQRRPQSKADMRHSMTQSLSANTLIDSSLIWPVSQLKVLKARQCLSRRKGTMCLLLILLQYVWLINTQSHSRLSFTNPSTSCSLPKILLPAATTAISLISLPIPKYKPKSLSNYLVKAPQFPNSFDSVWASIRRDQQTICGYSSFLPILRHWYTDCPVLRQREMVHSSRAGSCDGSSTFKELSIYFLTSQGQKEQQSRSSMFSTNQLPISVYILLLSFLLRLNRSFLIWNNYLLLFLKLI